MSRAPIWYAYACSRDRHRVNPRRHAVHEMAHMCGALDMECTSFSPKVRATIYLGEWQSGHPDNCVVCAAAVALAALGADDGDFERV